MQKVNRSEFTGLEIVSVVVIGLDNPVSASFGVGASPESAHVRSSVVAMLTEPCRFRHRGAGRR